MNKNLSFTSEINFDQGTYRLLYFKFKPYIFPLLIIFVCLMLFLNVLMPQFSEILGSADEEKILKENLAISKSNLALFTNLSDAEIDTKLDTALSSVPSEKDFSGILNAISLSAARSGSMLDDFSFTVGDLSTTSAKLSKQPSLQLNLSLVGGVEQNMIFLKELEKALPLSEVTKFSMNDDVSSFTVLFYYRPFSSLSYDTNKPMGTLSAKDLELLKNLSSWNNGKAEVPVFFQASSSSGRTNPFE